MTALGRYDTVRQRPALDEWMSRRLFSGWTNQAVATACGVSVRTVQRWRASLVSLEDVVVDGYVATFALRRGRPPARVSAWRRAA